MFSSSGAAARPEHAVGRRKNQWGMLKRSVTGARWLLLEASGVFLLSFVRWFQIPSPFASAALLASGRKPTWMSLAGLAASLILRLVWGLEPDWWQFAGCGLLWLALQKCKPNNLLETAVLGGLATVPRIAATLSHGALLPVIYSCASLPLGMLAAAALHAGWEAAVHSGPACGKTDKCCLLFAVMLVISGLGFFRVGSVNLGQLAAVACTAIFASASHSVIGVLCGLMCGLALLVTGHPGGLVLPLSLIGLTCGLPGERPGRWHVLPAALLANVLSCVLLYSFHPLLGWWACGLGAAAAMLLPSKALQRLKPWLRGMETGERGMENAFVAQRIAHMRDAIENLARALPEQEEPLSAGEELGGLLCVRCSNREQCWGKGREKTQKMLEQVMVQEKENEGQNLPALEGFGCLRVQEAPQAAQEALLNFERKQAARKKAHYERELTLTHLAALSGTLSDLGSMSLGENFHDLRSAHVIEKKLEELHLPARLVYARRVEGHLMAALETRGLTKKALDLLLSTLAEEEIPLSISRAEGGRLELEETPLYSASVGMASLCADGSSSGICGDSCCAKRCEGGRLLMMLCDGMGHGEGAHRLSEKTIELLLLLLQAGYTRHQAITAVNGMMMGTEEERFSTVDLVDVDLWSGEVVSEKLGACASWVVRGNHMKKMEGSSLPLGIVQEASPTAVQYRLHSGDILLLMSDGVADCFAGDDQLKQAIMDSLFIQPQRMADSFLRAALLCGGGTPRDDMSVMVLLLMDRQRANGT